MGLSNTYACPERAGVLERVTSGYNDDEEGRGRRRPAFSSLAR